MDTLAPNVARCAAGIESGVVDSVWRVRKLSGMEEPDGAPVDPLHYSEMGHLTRLRSLCRQFAAALLVYGSAFAYRHSCARYVDWSGVDLVLHRLPAQLYFTSQKDVCLSCGCDRSFCCLW